MKKTSFLKYIAALILFGSNGVVASAISLGSQQIVLVRTLLGSLLLVALYLLHGGKFSFIQYKKQLVSVLISGIAMGASWMFLYEAYNRIGVSIASLLYYCGPVIVMIVSPYVFGEKLTRNKLLGFAIVLAGVVSINFGTSQGGMDAWGIGLGLLSAAMYAVMVIFNKRATDIVGLENSALQLTTAFLTVAVFVGVTQGYRMTFASEDLVPMLMLGLINTGLGCYLYFSSIGKLPVQTVAVCGYLEPLSAVLFSVLLLSEQMSLFQYIGAVCIIGGAMYSEWAKNHADKKKRS